MLKGGDGILLTSCGADESGAAPVSGVVEDQRGDAIGGDQALCRCPVLDDLADAMTNEECGSLRPRYWPDDDRIEVIFAGGNERSLDGCPGCLNDPASVNSSENSIPCEQNLANTGDGESKYPVLNEIAPIPGPNRFPEFVLNSLPDLTDGRNRAAQLSWIVSAHSPAPGRRILSRRRS